MGGTLRNPTLNLISDPSLPDASVLSYIAFGKPPSDASEGENALLYQAAAALGSSGAGKITDSISGTLGLDALEVDTGSNPNEASLVVGKYLSPDLYISYGIGLFDAVNTFNMRYQLSDRLSFESAVGENSSADLLYSVDR